MLKETQTGHQIVIKTNNVAQVFGQPSSHINLIMLNRSVFLSHGEKATKG